MDQLIVKSIQHKLTEIMLFFPLLTKEQKQLMTVI